jgi:hypothetical protein
LTNEEHMEGTDASWKEATRYVENIDRWNATREKGKCQMHLHLRVWTYSIFLFLISISFALRFCICIFCAFMSSFFFHFLSAVAFCLHF